MAYEDSNMQKLKNFEDSDAVEQVDNESRFSLFHKKIIAKGKN